jgi:NADPH-dependent curcumin reductase CurA
VTQHLSVLSIIIGLTAWHGVNKVLNPASGDVLVVSAGAGAVGSLVGQLAKLKGAKVVGIAGSAAKCKFMKDEVLMCCF